ncbi:MAG: Mut7-C RNAse domain-containing protein [Candidatus Thermoplasmatota archaeon]|nr:Mut7-C RNAse domain-containing protein [Candidatus Thermoplasmatota archaeon]
MTEELPNSKFVADQMLGSLARWLRMMGYDTVYDKKLDDASISGLARAEGRFVLTRDKELAREPGALLVESDDLDSQLKEVATRYGLKFRPELIRCSACNGDLAELTKDQAKEMVPEGAFISNDRFWKCGKCGKVFWKGTHWNGIMDRLNRLGLA